MVIHNINEIEKKTCTNNNNEENSENSDSSDSSATTPKPSNWTNTLTVANDLEENNIDLEDYIESDTVNNDADCDDININDVIKMKEMMKLYGTLKPLSFLNS